MRALPERSKLFRGLPKFNVTSIIGRYWSIQHLVFSMLRIQDVVLQNGKKIDYPSLTPLKSRFLAEKGRGRYDRGRGIGYRGQLRRACGRVGTSREDMDSNPSRGSVVCLVRVSSSQKLFARHSSKGGTSMKVPEKHSPADHSGLRFRNRNGMSGLS